jgi:hypothetical protein
MLDESLSDEYCFLLGIVFLSESFANLSVSNDSIGSEADSRVRAGQAKGGLSLGGNMNSADNRTKKLELARTVQ